jgi:hypothetical protein
MHITEVEHLPGPQFKNADISKCPSSKGTTAATLATIVGRMTAFSR